MSLISFDDCLIPESNIAMIRQQRRASGEWVWEVCLKDRDRSLIDTIEPSIVMVLPNTSGVRMLLVTLYNSNSTPSHNVSERPIVAWRTEARVPGGNDVMFATAIAPDYIEGSNVTWCYFDPVTGEHWDGDFSDTTRDAAVERMLEDLRGRRERIARAQAKAPA